MAHFRWKPGWSASLLLGAIALARAADAPTTATGVVIESEEPTVRRVLIDRRHPQKDMPKLDPGEAALTKCEFACSAACTYETTEKKQTDGKWHVTVRLRSVRLKANLADTVYLPPLAPQRLVGHEEGHRAMNERVYREGEAVACSAAGEILNQQWSGDGDTPETAAKVASDGAIRHLCDAYLAATADRASHLGDVYDKLTDHGRNSLLVAQAIKLSFEEEKKEAATRPSMYHHDVSMETPQTP